ncbi:MAG: hypothetical protein QM541_14815 [Flavobacterium sp.]|nr:hypothetical protein [Flavobacterium sp.]
MSKNIKCISGIVFSLLLTLSSCTKQDKTFGDLTAPSAPVIDVQVVGKTTAAPYGDSSGKVIITITSTNAINYKVSFGDGTDTLGTKNQFSYGYSHIGLKTLNVTVTTTGKGGIASTTTSAAFTLFRKFTPNAELVTMLTNNGSKTWKVDSASPGNIGVGPINTFTSDWYNAAPNEKAGVGMYDDEFIFTKNTSTFTHKTNNSLFGHKENLKDFDGTLTGTGDYTLLGSTAATYSETFSYDGTGTTEYIVFGAKGHMGLYVGGHKYQILSRTATQMYLRCVGTDGNAWYVRIKAI